VAVPPSSFVVPVTAAVAAAAFFAWRHVHVVLGAKRKSPDGGVHLNWLRGN
jgi:hypothetical protein